MKRFDGIIRTTHRILLVGITLSLCAALSGTAMAKGGGSGSSGHGGGSGKGGSGKSSSGHGGESGERHGSGRHGSIVRQLPNGHIDVSHRGNHFFYHEGRFFNRHSDGFIVVSAPIGVVVPSLSVSAAMLTVGGLSYYVADDNYFRRVPEGFVVVESPHR